MSDINEKSNFVFEFQPVTKLFEEQVRLHPDKCAVASSKESFTYAQLNERANRIANSLIEKGVGCEKIVGVVLERCCDFYAVRQGILKAGGTVWSCASVTCCSLSPASSSPSAWLRFSEAVWRTSFSPWRSSAFPHSPVWCAATRCHSSARRLSRRPAVSVPVR